MILVAHHLTKSFNHPLRVDVLKKIDLEVRQGESIAIMGRSGEGKSTLLHLLGTLEEPTSGTLEICGEKASAALRNQKIGFVFQNFHLLEDETVLRNVLIPAEIGRRDTSAGSPAWKRAEALLKAVGLTQRSQFPTKLLSGGEKQRTAIARALCNDPELILADEPTGNLDRAAAREVFELLLNLCKSYGKTLIVATHDPELAALCSRTVRLQDGVLC